MCHNQYLCKLLLQLNVLGISGSNSLTQSPLLEKFTTHWFGREILPHNEKDVEEVDLGGSRGHDDDDDD